MRERERGYSECDAGLYPGIYFKGSVQLSGSPVLPLLFSRYRPSRIGSFHIICMVLTSSGGAGLLRMKLCTSSNNLRELLSLHFSRFPSLSRGWRPHRLEDIHPYIAPESQVRGDMVAVLTCSAHGDERKSMTLDCCSLLYVINDV